MAAKKSSKLSKTISALFTTLLAPLAVSVVSATVKSDLDESARIDRPSAIRTVPVSPAPQYAATLLPPLPEPPAGEPPRSREVIVEWRPATPNHD